MPKIKTNKTMSKRVKLTASGQIMHRNAARAHKLSGKSAARKREYALEFAMPKGNSKTAKKMLGI